MKLIIAIVKDTDNDPVSHALTSADLRVTCVASTGGFLRRGQATLLCGVEDEQVETAMDIIRKTVTPKTDGDSHSAVMFVLKVDQYVHF